MTATGATSEGVDPLKCRSVDPVITVFWGERNSTLNGPGIVVRVNYSRASFLFLDDLRGEGAEDLFAEYAKNLGVFHVYVLGAPSRRR